MKFHANAAQAAYLQRRLHQWLRPHLATIVPRHGVSLSQYDLLTHINDASTLEDRPPAMGGVAEMLAVPCNTLTRQVERLEELGLVQRTRDNLDRRVIRIQVLEKGQRTLNAVHEALDQLELPMDGFKPAVYQEVLHTLLKLSQEQNRQRQSS